MSTVRVDLDYLARLHDDVSDTIANMDASRPEGVTIPSDSRADNILKDFQQRWDKRRGELGDSLRGVEQALATMRETWEGTDNEMACQLEEGG